MNKKAVYSAHENREKELLFCPYRIIPNGTIPLGGRSTCGIIHFFGGAGENQSHRKSKQ